MMARFHLYLPHSLLHAYLIPLTDYSANVQPLASPMEILAMTARGGILTYSALLMTSHPAFTSPTSTFYVIRSVGNLPQGYMCNVPLPRIPLRQSTSSNQTHMIPDYYKVPYGVPPYNTHHSIVENAAYAFSPAWHAIAIKLRTTLV